MIPRSSASVPAAAAGAGSVGTDSERHAFDVSTDNSATQTAAFLGSVVEPRLRLRFTFLAVDKRPASAAVVRRARSFEVRRGEALNEFAEKLDYVEGLSRRLPSLWAAVAAGRVDDVFSQSTSQLDMSETSVLPGNAARPAPQTLATSEGSIGHPFTCSRQCRFFASGTCRDGAKCACCHLCHGRRMVQVGRSQRETLAQMEPSVALALVLPLVRRKALAIDDSEATLAVFDRFAGEWSSGIGAAGAPGSARRHRRLYAALSAADLRPLLIALQHTVLQDVPAALAAGEHLLRHLRSIAGASAGVCSETLVA